MIQYLEGIIEKETELFLLGKEVNYWTSKGIRTGPNTFDFGDGNRFTKSDDVKAYINKHLDFFEQDIKDYYLNKEEIEKKEPVKNEVKILENPFGE